MSVDFVHGLAALDELESLRAQLITAQQDVTRLSEMEQAAVRRAADAEALLREARERYIQDAGQAIKRAFVARIDAHLGAKEST